MTRKHWLHFGPSLLVGAGIILATLIAALAAKSGWLVMAAPLTLALAVVGADVLDSGLRRESPVPSPAALILGGAVLLAGLIVSVRDPNLVRTLISLVGAGAWVTLLRRPGRGRQMCRGL
jgi:hypothetical protein